ncbi:helix-turn-helix domain-containing protein [Lawsonibacter sp. OA9]|uniref:helix-turn-helix domain-containing protein n=1 Tax=Oscillospiraceae TaxID=216572 RepID=UPI001DD4EF00|nr:helix-turn-helix domain-containing protein [Lawsonibacter sp. OA9]MBS5589303.1 helix-turn-helix domain-containing protein [Clostridiales bacterium]MCH1980816.1 helix-turn-helix domain-containing protein [Lawsonibacter sp. OA9]
MERKYHSFDELPLTLRVEDLMPILGIGRNTAYELVPSKQIYSVKVGRQLRIPKQSLIDYLKRKP